MALLYIVNLFSGLIEDSWIIIFSSAFTLLQYDIVSEVWRKLDFTWIYSSKREGILLDLLNDCGFSLILY